MCGIAGIYNEKKDRSIAHDIKKILKKIKHRGPDGKGFFIDKNKLALGNTRLSIQDVSRNGNQPIYSACKRYIIVFLLFTLFLHIDDQQYTAKSYIQTETHKTNPKT